MLDAASIWSGPDGGDPTCWMIIGMIKAHSIFHRMLIAWFQLRGCKS
jgi:hypothetical protein